MKQKKLLLGIGLPLIATLPIIAITSCSKNSSSNISEIKFETKTTLNSLQKNTTYNVYQADENQDAISKLNQFIANNLTKENLQREFDLLLLDFYESYEQKNNVSEIEIERIEVLKRNDLSNNKYSFTLRVWMEKETETKDKEELISKEIEWTPTIKLISYNEIEKIKETIKQYTQKGTNSNIDLSDIKEIFFGEKDADDFDDWGVFDKLKLFNRDYQNLAYLLGYELSLNDIFGQLNIQTRTGVNLNTKFTIPSLILNSSAVLFVPNNKPDIDFTQKTNLTQQTLDSIFTSASQEITDVTQIVEILNKLLANELSSNDLVGGAKEIKKIELKNENGKYMLIVHYANAKKIPDLIYFSTSQN